MIQRFVAEARDRAANITNATFPSVFKILRGTINFVDHTLAELLGSLEQSRIKEANLRPVGRNLSISRELTVKRVLASALSGNRSKIINFGGTVAQPFAFHFYDDRFVKRPFKISHFNLFSLDIAGVAPLYVTKISLERRSTYLVLT